MLRRSLVTLAATVLSAAIMLGTVAVLVPLAVQAQTPHEPSGSIAPAAEAVAVTPSDATVYSPPCRSIYVGGAGTVVVDMARTGSDISFVAVAADVTLPIVVTKVKAATSATNLVCLY